MTEDAQEQPDDPHLAGLPSPLRSALEVLKKTIDAHDDDPQPDEAAIVMRRSQLPLPFARDNPGLPNSIMRAALFPVLPPDGARPFLKKAQLFAVDGLSVSFTGQRFDQSDLDVLLGIFEIGRYQELGHRFSFAAHELLKTVGRSVGGSDHEWLHSVLTRLTGGVVEIRHNRKRFFGALLLGGVRDDASGRYMIAINADLAVMFGFGMWSFVELQQRNALGRNQTAKVFHLYYSSHAAPGKHSYQTLAALADLQNKQKADVKRKIIKAHDALKATSFLIDYQADKDGIAVTKRDTPSQVRHLAGQSPEQRRRRRRRQRQRSDTGLQPLRDGIAATMHGSAATKTRDGGHKTTG